MWFPWGALFNGVTKLLDLLFKFSGLLFVYNWARAKSRAESAEKGLDHAKRGLEIDETVNNMSDDERYRWLYGKHRDD